jgi:hypothetical protein
MTGPDALIGVRISHYRILRMTGVISDAGPAKRKHDEAHRQEGSYLPVATVASVLLQPDFSLRRARRSPLLVATRRRSMKKDDEGQASTAFDLALGESDRFSQAIGACDEHI